MNVIEASGLGKRYGGTWALRECSLAIPAGHVAALVGPNGAGKTTLLNLAVGLAEPSAGVVTVLGGMPAGSTAARAVSAAHRRDRLAGPPPGGLSHPATMVPRALWATRPRVSATLSKSGSSAAISASARAPALVKVPLVSPWLAGRERRSR